MMSLLQSLFQEFRERFRLRRRFVLLVPACIADVKVQKETRGSKAQNS